MLRSKLLQRVLANGEGLLLDTYSGAVGAYSLRYLSASFLGNDVILVRRSSDNAEQGFTPTEITDGTLESFCGVGNGFVKTWFDQSGNGNDVTSPTNAEQPEIINSGSVILQNGSPTIGFDGADDNFLNDTTQIDFSNFFIAYVGFDGAGRNTIIASDIGFPFNEIAIGRWEENLGLRIYETLSNIRDYGPLAQAYDLTILTSSSSGSEVFVNGVSFGTNAQLISNITGFNISHPSYNPHEGNIQEIIFYESDQSSNRSAIETNINDYYGIY